MSFDSLLLQRGKAFDVALDRRKASLLSQTATTNPQSTPESDAITGHDTTPNAASGRIVYQVGALAGIVVVAAYSAALISFLTVNLKEYPVRSFEELLRANGRYKIGIRATSGQFTLLQASQRAELPDWPVCCLPC